MKFLLCLIIVLIPSLTACSFYPPYYTWQQEQEGKAELAKADYSKQVMVQEAKAKKESATYLAEAEVERAKGVAMANKIIGDSLRDNESYLRWLYIEGLKERNGIETIYVPTEAGLPILEAGKRPLSKKQ
jgi:regulator of protease activity HflC (stomatin/prohibitin superfamily)